MLRFTGMLQTYGFINKNSLLSIPSKTLQLDHGYSHHGSWKMREAGPMETVSMVTGAAASLLSVNPYIISRVHTSQTDFFPDAMLAVGAALILVIKQILCM